MPETLKMIIIGVGVVLIGLALIFIIRKIMSNFCKPNTLNKTEVDSPVKQEASSEPSENRQEILAAVCAVIAEELGTDVEALKVHSFKKI